MKLTIQKLKHLWEQGVNQVVKRAATENVNRIGRILDIVNGWDNNASTIGGLSIASFDNKKSYEHSIPTASWPAVRNNFKNIFAQYSMDIYSNQITEIEELLRVADRKELYRIASNADPQSKYETDNCVITQKNPESWYASYNYPFEIIQYYLKSKPGFTPVPLIANDNPDSCPDEKFILKFLWMLANREHYISILSLVSFYKLSPIIAAVAKSEGITGVNWGGTTNWNLSLSDFQKYWPKVSENLALQITGTGFSGLTQASRIELSKLLFIASIEETTTKNALDMLRTGNRAMIFYGPPGTGKTFQAEEVTKKILGTASKDEYDKCNFSSSSRPKSSLTGCWELIQFHPGYTYNDFIGGILPELNGTSGDLTYRLNEGIFKRFCDAATKAADEAKTANEAPPPYLLIIDEINRADLSAVFGELMYVLEYRGKSVNIPNFNVPFTIPENVYIIGTMNSVDKSLVTFDLALRRRFLFFKLMPDMSTISSWNNDLDRHVNDDDLNLLIDKANTLNIQLVTELDLPEDYGIGQAYFIKIKDFCVESTSTDGVDELRITPFSREQLWIYHLEPLFEEYLGAELTVKTGKLKKMKDEFVR